MLTRFSLVIVFAATTTLTTLSGVGCTSVDSDGIFTSALYARVSATSDGTGSTTVRATLFLESPSSLNYIELEGDDELTVYGPGGESKRMRETQFLGTTSYSASFEAEDAGSEFIVELSRTVDDSAPDSRVTLPAAFDVLTASGASYSRGSEDVVVDWDPFDSGDDMDFDVTGNCIETISGSLEGDPGTLTIGGDELILREGDTTPDSCSVTVTITRGRPGTIDEAYGHGGDAYAYQSRSFDFTTQP